MTDSDNIAVVTRFIARINAHDVDGICAMLPENHVFVDSGGARYEGRETLRGGWTEYLKLFPDYHVEIEHIFAADQLVAVFGRARGTYSGDSEPGVDKRWDCTAAWLAVVRDGLIAEWRVYADNEHARRILAQHSSDKSR